jgi:F0F1-type ATP synthase assembly protein I
MNDKSNKNQNENYKPQDSSKNNSENNSKDKFDINSSDKLARLEDKFYKQLKETEDKLDKEFGGELNKNFNSDQIYKENPMKNLGHEPPFKNSYTDKLDVASKKREEALKKGSNKYIKYSSIGVEMIGSVLLGGFGGNWLDKRTELGFPLFTIALILLGLGATFTHLIMQLNADRKEEEEEEKKSKS